MSPGPGGSRYGHGTPALHRDHVRGRLPHRRRGPVTTSRTRLERSFDPERVRALVDGASNDVSISGLTLAAEAFRRGIVDDIELYLVPVLVGGGLRALPDGVRLGLEPAGQRRFGNGFVFLHYRRRRGQDGR